MGREAELSQVLDMLTAHPAQILRLRADSRLPRGSAYLGC
jgi:hypothetical protein